MRVYGLGVGDVHNIIFLLEPPSQKLSNHLSILLDNATVIVPVGQSLVGSLEVGDKFFL